MLTSVLLCRFTCASPFLGDKEIMEAAVNAAMEPPAHTVDQAVDRIMAARAAASQVRGSCVLLAALQTAPACVRSDCPAVGCLWPHEQLLPRVSCHLAGCSWLPAQAAGSGEEGVRRSHGPAARQAAQEEHCSCNRACCPRLCLSPHWQALLARTSDDSSSGADTGSCLQVTSGTLALGQA